MESVATAMGAIFFDGQFFIGIDLIAFADVIKRPTDSAN